MPRLQIRDVKEELDTVRDGLDKLVINFNIQQSRLNKIKNAVYILAVIQLGLVSHLIFSVLSK